MRWCTTRFIGSTPVPAQDGVSATQSPSTIITGRVAEYGTHCRLQFGAYCQVYTSTNNTMEPQTVGAIALRPTGNAQGGYYFFTLDMGRRISGYKWSELPMPQQVIDRIHLLAQKGREINTLEFLNRDKEPYPDKETNQIAGVDDEESSDSDYSDEGSSGSNDDDLSNDGSDGISHYPAIANNPHMPESDAEADIDTSSCEPGPMPRNSGRRLMGTHPTKNLTDDKGRRITIEIEGENYSLSSGESLEEEEDADEPKEDDTNAVSRARTLYAEEKLWTRDIKLAYTATTTEGKGKNRRMADIRRRKKNILNKGGQPRAPTTIKDTNHTISTSRYKRHSKRGK